MVKAGLIVPVGVQGVFGRNARVRGRARAASTPRSRRLATDDHADYFVFPPMIDRRILEKVGYMDSFPQLAGTVHSFFGKELDARKLSERIHAGERVGRRDGDDRCLAQSRRVLPALSDAARHGAGRRPRRDDVQLGVPARAVARADAHAGISRARVRRVRAARAWSIAWRDTWLERGKHLLESLGLPAKADVATDPFFGKGGKMLAASQREQKLKFEVLVPVISRENPTACCSFNYHEAQVHRCVRASSCPTARPRTPRASALASSAA